MKKILIVATHQDDEVLGAGGFIAKMCAQGNYPRILILCTGNASRKNGFSDNGNEKYKSALAYSQMSGLIPSVAERFVEVLNFPDNNMSSVPLGDIADAIARKVKEQSSTLILTHSASDLNRDHRITLEATLIATRPSKSTAREVISFEIPSSTEVAFSQYGHFRPTIFEELIYENLVLKTVALESYETEIQSPPETRSFTYIVGLATVRGNNVNCYYAEALELIWRRQ